MKNFSIVSLVGVFFIVSTGSSQEYEDKVLRIILENKELCLNDISPNNADRVRKDVYPDNEEIRCFKKCVLNRMGILTDGKMNILKLEEIMSEIKPEKAGKAIVEAVQKCKGKAGASDNECEVGAKYYDCISNVRVF